MCQKIDDSAYVSPSQTRHQPDETDAPDRVGHALFGVQ